MHNKCQITEILADALEKVPKLPYRSIDIYFCQEDIEKLRKIYNQYHQCYTCRRSFQFQKNKITKTVFVICSFNSVKQWQ